MSAKSNTASYSQTSRISINMGNERVFVNLDEIFYIEKTGRYTLICCVNGKFESRQTLKELEQHLGTKFFRSHKSFIINTDRIERIVPFPNSSYYEVKFNNCKDKALLSRDRMHELMKYSNYNFWGGIKGTWNNHVPINVYFLSSFKQSWQMFLLL